MTDTKGQDRNTKIGLARPSSGRLELKTTVEGGTVRQSFSHGRSKAVAVEVKRTRGGHVGPTPPPPPAPRAPVPPARPAAVAPPPVTRAPAPVPTAEVAPPPPVAVAPPVVEPVAPPPPVVEVAPPAVTPVETQAPAAVEPPPPAAPVAAAPVAEAAVPAPAPTPPVAAPSTGPRMTAPPPASGGPRMTAPPPASGGPRMTAPPPASGGPRMTAPPPPARPAAPTPSAPRPAATASVGPRRGVVLKPLTEEERKSRLLALAGARKSEEDARRRAEEESRRRGEEEARRRADEEASAKRKAEEELRRKAEDEARRKAEEQAQRLLADEERRSARAAATGGTPARPGAGATAAPVGARGALKSLLEEEEEARKRARGKPGPGGAGPRPGLRPAPRREVPSADIKQRIVIGQDGVDVEERGGRSLAALRRAALKARGKAVQPRAEAVVREVLLPETITVQDLAARMAVRGAEVIKVLMKNGVMATINHVVDADTAELVVAEFGHKVKRVSEAQVEEGIEGIDDRTEDLAPRPPVVTVMGHVDHGKTSLLDALRQSDVASHEAGGITQHIGAYRVDIGAGMPVTFIDTPGHAAFTSMRARGASVTDVVVLVVAADDGVMPQTIEAIRHAKAAGVPIVVAINKVDKADADPSRVKNELLSHEVVVEDFGGEVQAVEVSATKKVGLDKLIEAIQLQAELADLRANPGREAQGAVIEAKLDKGRGVVATVLIQKGTLHVRDYVVCGSAWGRVRSLVDDRGREVTEAGPSVPIEVLGLDSVPDAGEALTAVENEARAREVSDYRTRKKREQGLVAAAGGRGSLEDMFKQIQKGDLKELPVVVKSDVHGSLEAISAGLQKLGTDEVSVRVLHGAVGAITESDITLAAASKAVVIGFNVRANAPARDLAKRDGVEIRYYSIIYELLDEMKGLLSGMLSPEAREVILGHAEIREIFTVPKVGKIAGCRVVDGLMRRSAKARLLRDNVVIWNGELSSLKRFKDDAREVKEGFECGIGLEGYNDLQIGDLVETYDVEEVARSL